MRLIKKRTRAGLAAIFLLIGAPQAQALEDASLCAVHAARQEQLQAIPSRLLHAISLVESGRWDAERRASFAWPWTVMAEGEGRFLPSKAAAVAEVRKLQARGVRNIDVGCMQVNLQAHPDAFASLEEAFDPAANVAYAARFLQGLYSSTHDWPTAAAYYHSQTPDLANAYKTRLMPIWAAARARPDDALQMASLQSGPENRPPVGILAEPSFSHEFPPQFSGNQPPRLAGDTARMAAHAAAAVAAQKAEHLAKTAAERAEAKRIADAYRQARLAEYRLRKGVNHG